VGAGGDALSYRVEVAGCGVGNLELRGEITPHRGESGLCGLVCVVGVDDECRGCWRGKFISGITANCIHQDLSKPR